MSGKLKRLQFGIVELFNRGIAKGFGKLQITVYLGSFEELQVS